ncbi:MAG: BrnA antitoxin family protein [Fluviibacter phosphoraccumulans]
MYLKTKSGRKVLLNTAEEDAAINAGIAADPDTAELSDAQMARLKPVRGRPIGSGTKSQVSLRIDTDVLEFFKAQGSGWQTKINATLRASLKKHRKAA